VNPTPCLAPEDLDRVLSAAAEDPRRVHARSCVRCGALIAAYESYREAREDAPPRVVPRRLVFARPVPRFGWLRPAFGIAAILVVAGALWWPRTTLGPSRVTLRGGTATAPRIALEPPVFHAGRLAVRWAAYAGAERYEVRFYSSDLAELGRLPATGASLDAGTAQLPFTPDSAGVVLVRVVALVAGSEVASSAPKTLEVR
jgi:hypothetical protein